MNDGVYITVPVEVAERQARERAQLVAIARRVSGLHGRAVFATHVLGLDAAKLLRELGETA